MGPGGKQEASPALGTHRRLLHGKAETAVVPPVKLKLTLGWDAHLDRNHVSWVLSWGYEARGGSPRQGQRERGREEPRLTGPGTSRLAVLFALRQTSFRAWRHGGWTAPGTCMPTACECCLPRPPSVGNKHRRRAREL